MEAHAEQDQEQRMPEWLAEAEEELERFARAAGLEQLEEPERLTDREELLDYYLEQIQEAMETMAHNQEVAERRIRMVESWLEEENGRVAHTVEWYESKVRQLVPPTVDGFQEVFGVKKKSRNLPHGTVGFRSSRDTIQVVDEEKALDWAEEHCPDAIKVRRSVLKTPITAELDGPVWRPTGEVLDPEETGLEPVPGTDTFYMKLRD